MAKTPTYLSGMLIGPNLAISTDDRRVIEIEPLERGDFDTQGMENVIRKQKKATQLTLISSLLAQKMHS